MTEEQWIKAFEKVGHLEDIFQALRTLNSWDPFSEAFKGTGLNHLETLARIECQKRLKLYQ